MAPRLLRQGASDQFVCEAAFESGGTSKISYGRRKSRMNEAANPTIDTDRWGAGFARQPTAGHRDR